MSKVQDQLYPNQQPLGSQFKSYELTEASNYWTLDPFQYSITKFRYNLPGQQRNGIPSTDFKNDPGLIYKQVDFEKLLPAYTAEKKSVNDFPAQSYHRFNANEGYFNPNESNDNSDLWYYGANNIANTNGIAGAALNLQEVNHIIFPEAQRGGLNTQSLAKYSWSPTIAKDSSSIKSWEEENTIPVNNDSNCKFFNYNSNQDVPFDKVYQYDSNYCRHIGINSPQNGSMPFYG
jgi:hypothetical protein